MLSDMVWRGLFHHHIMTSGGRTATPARTAQADNDLKLPAMAAAHTAEIQTVVTVALMERNCIDTSVRARAERRCSRVNRDTL